ncbi:MAG: hypothetical protein ACOZFS_07355 [Thermodesulfobacteriota bacterium]
MAKQETMPATKQLTADALFLVQLALAMISGGSEFLVLLTTSQGVNLTWLASWLAFLLINLALTIRAHRIQPSRVTLQTVLSYAAWTIMIGACLGAMLYKGTELWDGKDTLTAIMVGAGLITTTLWANRLGLKLTDPLVNGFFAVCFIGLPQLTLAYKIFSVGGEGMAGAMLLAGHIGIGTRLGQLWFAIREAGWDRNRRGAALSEIANEITWLLVTLAWLIRHPGG